SSWDLDCRMTDCTRRTKNTRSRITTWALRRLPASSSNTDPDDGPVGAFLAAQPVHRGESAGQRDRGSERSCHHVLEGAVRPRDQEEAYAESDGEEQHQGAGEDAGSLEQPYHNHIVDWEPITSAVKLILGLHFGSITIVSAAAVLCGMLAGCATGP